MRVGIFSKFNVFCTELKLCSICHVKNVNYNNFYSLAIQSGSKRFILDEFLNDFRLK